MVQFKDRVDAARKLANRLKPYKASDTIVVGLARGGVVTAAEVARTLQLPLDVMIVRKIGAPSEEELAIGAITVHGVKVLNREFIKQMGISEEHVKKVIADEEAECARREKLYRGVYPERDLKGKTVILVDDGIATGMTIEAAIIDIKQQGAREIIVAVPIMPPDVVAHINKLCKKLVYLMAPQGFLAIGAFYSDFTQVEHDQVIDLLKKSETLVAQ
jgi:putative phosphoribosyl transferase